MSWISPIEMNMSISQNIYEGHWNNPLIVLAQKIAIYSIIPLALVVIFESIIKNLIFINLLNVGITVLNLTHDWYHARPGN
jgi:hypothetical protein